MTIQTIPPSAQLLRLPAVIERTGLSRSSVYRAEAAGEFPRRVKIGKRSTAWNAADVNQWIADRVAASRGATA